MMTIKKLLVVLVAFIVVGCSSSPYTYHVDSVPLKKGESSYYLKNIKVKLTQGHGAILGDTSFTTEEEMLKQFTSSLNEALNKKGILASNSSSADADLEMTIDYERRYNYGGKALNKPEVSHYVNISKSGEKLVSFGNSRYTTKYAYFKDAAVNIEIALFKWGADDELKDIDLISKLIVDDLSKVGK
jgi:hypothetical protein